MNIEMFFTTYPYNAVLLGCVVLATLLSIIAFFISIRSRNRIARILRGKSARDIDDVLIQIYRNISVLDQFRTNTKNELIHMNEKISNSIQSMETIRFNPFKGNGTGGNQSFATAIINDFGDGVILSSLYSSDRVSVYAKPLVKFSSSYELTEEEMQALEAARNKLKLD